MAPELHPSAAANYDAKADALVAYVRPIPEEQTTPPAFPSDIVTTQVTEADIIGDLEKSVVDHRGSTVARHFYIGLQQYGLDGIGYAALASLAEAMHQNRAFYEMLSQSFIADELFNWVRRKFKGEDSSQTFTEFLRTRAGETVHDISVWTPVANMEVEEAFPVGTSEIRPISKAQIDEWERDAHRTAKSTEHLAAHFERFRKRYQGLAAVVTQLRAEPDRGREFAREEAERVTSVLAIFSPAMLVPEVKCVSRPKGSENVRTSTSVVLAQSGGLFRTFDAVLDAASLSTWRLSANRIKQMRDPLLDRISELLTSAAPSDFERSAHTAILLYSKAAFTADPVEKIIYILTCLESVMLKNESESIGQNLAERLAILTATGLENRKKVIATVKAVYAIRSRYIHHGNTTADLAAISEFMLIAWHGVWNVVMNVRRFKTKEAFVGAIDDQKLGGR